MDPPGSTNSVLYSCRFSEVSPSDDGEIHRKRSIDNSGTGDTIPNLTYKVRKIKTAWKSCFSPIRLTKIKVTSHAARPPETDTHISRRWEGKTGHTRQNHKRALQTDPEMALLSVYLSALPSRCAERHGYRAVCFGTGISKHSSRHPKGPLIRDRFKQITVGAIRWSSPKRNYLRTGVNEIVEKKRTTQNGGQTAPSSVRKPILCPRCTRGLPGRRVGAVNPGEKGLC